MLQRLAVTFPKNDRMDSHGVNLTSSTFLLNPSPVATQGLDYLSTGWRSLHTFRDFTNRTQEMPAEVIQEVNPILQKMGSSKKKEMA